MAKIPLPNPNRSEAQALFRHAIVGDLVVSDLPRGALQDELKRRALQRYRPPGASASRTYHWKTLQRWLLAAREGLAALQPASRRRGFALGLDDEARELLLDMRREHPNAAADLLLDAAVRHGAVPKDALSLPTLRRLYAQEDLARVSRRPRAARARDRRRWETDRVGRVWHADVCHVWRRRPDGGAEKVYVHALLDDHSRYVLAIKACVAETENDLLELLVETLLRYPACEVLYVDNGSTYRGDLLTLALDRLDIRLVHAAPYDPEARGKMERFWRTLRQRLLDLDEAPHTLHELNAALLAWLDTDYHRRPHGGLMGDTPGRRFRAGLADLPSPKSAAQLALALEVSRTAKVRKDATFSVDGTLYEVRGRHLAGKTVQVSLDPFTDKLLRVQHDGADVPYAPCDARANARRGRGEPTEPAPPSTSRFQRIADVLQAARGVRDAD
jgi:transposase InsO family protein